MSDIHPHLIERYQLTLEKNPRSQVFAPLSEAYRKMGLIEEAFRISSRGVQFHPNFPGGHIALANVLMEKAQYESAKESLEKAIQLSPENILAFQKLGECCLKLRLGKEALRAFKMVLLFSPHNERAKQAVQKLETLTADEFEEDVFKMDRITSLGDSKDEIAIDDDEHLERIQPSENSSQEKAREIERKLSLLEAYIVRGQISEARELAERLNTQYPNQPRVLKHLKSLSERSAPTESKSEKPGAGSRRADWLREEKLKILKKLLQRVREEHDQRLSLL